MHAQHAGLNTSYTPTYITFRKVWFLTGLFSFSIKKK